MELKELKSEYEKLEKKYKMPSFAELNGAFEVEKIERESDILLHAMRKVMVEKMVNLLGLAEIFLSPNNIPRMYLTYLKTMTVEDKKELVEIYDSLSKLIIEGMPLELEYNEKKEAELIIKISSTWKTLKPAINNFFSRINSAVAQNNSGKEKSYFG